MTATNLKIINVKIGNINNNNNRVPQVGHFLERKY